MDTPMPLLKEERQKYIQSLLQANGHVTVIELSQAFDLSEATVRRDLESLATQGKLQRVHGGAIVREPSPPELPILERKTEQENEKKRLGRVAAELVQPGETIFLGSGTTILEVARALREQVGLTILSNSLPVLNLLSGTDNTLICLGGMLRPSELSFIGHLTEQALAEVRADKVFMGIRALTIEGLTNEYLPETLTDRAILNAGREIIIVADHTKFGRTATVLLAPLEKIHTLVTDHETDQDFVRALSEKNINVLLA
jgi:DeoR/GlpR family transcriptional regulator of sugar metabolism